MKLLDKIKDLFMDEVAEDEEIELEETEKEEYKEPPKDVLPKVMRDTIKKEEEKVELKRKNDENINKEEKISTLDDSNEPEKIIDSQKEFEDEIPSRNSRQNVNVLKMEKEVTKKVSELYPKKEEVKEKPKFKATPVISPVYGILDKNYRKEEVKEKPEETSIMKRPSKKVDFETVRKKAFGNLADEIKDNLMCENCELYKEVKKISSLKEDDLLYDMTVDEESTEVTIEKAYDDYEEFGVAYEPKGKHEEDLVIEDKKIEEKEEPIINNNVDKEEKNEEELPSRSSRGEKKKETKVDEDFFELIDSMYKD